MATRLYFHPAAGAAATPGSWSAGWNKTSGTVADATLLAGPWYGPTAQAKTNTGSGTSGHFTAIGRWISAPLTAQTISGTVKGQTRCTAALATDNYTFAFAIKVIQADGTDRGVLVGVSASDNTAATPPEISTAATNRRWQNSAESASISLSSLAVSSGDRIVVEQGFRQASTATSVGTIAVAAGSGLGDLPENDSDTGVQGWVEFSNTITFAAAYFGRAETPGGESAVATGVADPTAVTPPTGMLAGDLVCMIGHQRLAAAPLAVSATGGQTWTSETAIGGTTITARLFWCVFNGTWSADPSVDFSAATCNSVQMHVFRPPTTGHVWSVNQAQVELDIAAGTGVHTITGQTTTGSDPTVTLAGWFTADDNNWSTTSGTAWHTAGREWYANTSGSDQSSTYAYKIQTAAGATGNVSRTQSLNGPDASTSFIITFAAAGGAKTLAADTVAFSFTGATTTTLELGRELVPEAGAYSFSGTDANFRKGLIVVPEVGSYSFAGQEVTLDRTFKLIPEAGAFSFAGQTASLEHGWELVPEAGSYSVSGQDVTLDRTFKLIPEAGSFAFAGQEVTFDRTYRLIVEAAAFTFAGSDVTLTYAPAAEEFVLPADAGAFAYTGQDASLEHGWRLVAEATSYSFSGVVASLEHGREIATEAGAYSFAGQDVTLDRTYRLVAAAGAWSFAGQDVTLDRTYKIIPEAGNYAYTGAEASLIHEVAGQTILGAAGGSFSFSGSDVSLEHGWELLAQAGSYSFAGSDASLERGQELLAEAGSYTFTGQQASLEHGWEVAAQAGSYSFAGQDAALVHQAVGETILVAGAGSYVFGGSAATLTYTPTAPAAPVGGWSDQAGGEFWVRKWREQAQALKPAPKPKVYAEAVAQDVVAAPAAPAPAPGDDGSAEIVEFTDFIRLLEKL